MDVVKTLKQCYIQTGLWCQNFQLKSISTVYNLANKYKNRLCSKLVIPIDFKQNMTYYMFYTIKYVQKHTVDYLKFTAHYYHIIRERDCQPNSIHLCLAVVQIQKQKVAELHSLCWHPLLPGTTLLFFSLSIYKFVW